MRPEVLKNLNMFLDGRGKAGRIEEFVTPKITHKVEEFRGGGMNAPIELEMGMEKLEASFTIKEHVKENAASLGLLDGQSIQITLRGAVDTGNEVKSIVIQMRGRAKEMDQGTWKPGEDTPIKFALSLDYYKYLIAGSEVLEIDVLNFIYKVNGRDKLEEQRKALGL